MKPSSLQTCDHYPCHIPPLDWMEEKSLMLQCHTFFTMKHLGCNTLTIHTLVKVCGSCNNMLTHVGKQFSKMLPECVDIENPFSGLEH